MTAMYRKIGDSKWRPVPRGNKTMIAWRAVMAMVKSGEAELLTFDTEAAIKLPEKDKQ